jgi:hypothetical protein
MKFVKKFAFAIVLASVLAVSTPAGEIGTPSYTAKPTPTPATSSDEAKNTYGDPVAVDTMAETSDYLLYEALAALISSVY